MDPSSDPHDGREALAGAAAGATAAGYASHEHQGHGHNYEGDPCDANAPNEPSGAIRHTEGPHATETANRLDPHLHIPGEFPETPAEESAQPTYAPTPRMPEPASDGHHYGRDAALTGAGAAAAGGVLGRDKSETAPESTQPLPDQRDGARDTPRGTGGVAATERGLPGDTTPIVTNLETMQPDQHHYGRDAALGTAGVAAADKELPRKEHQTSTSKATHPETTEQQAKPDQHHYGRDAALAGAGATAAGGAAYVYADDRAHRSGPKETDPASATVGPHKSNVANILDPRVQPEPEKMKSNRGRDDPSPAPHTTGPHKSDFANVADPRVLPQPEKMKDPETAGPHKAHPATDEYSNPYSTTAVDSRVDGAHDVQPRQSTSSSRYSEPQ